MGLFKKKQKHKEVNILSGDGIVSYFRSNLKNPTAENVLKAMQSFVKPDKDLKHLTKEGELPWGWLYANREFTEQIETEYRYFSDNVSKAKTVLEKYGALKSLVQYQQDVKNLCKSKGECFEFWATFMVADPVTMERNSAELKHMEDHIDELLEQEKQANRIRQELPRIIKKEPGVIQSDLYKRYDPSCKNIISNELYQMEARGKIRREKSGRSYALYMK